jgi:hypothetical protein
MLGVFDQREPAVIEAQLRPARCAVSVHGSRPLTVSAAAGDGHR